MSKRNDYSSKAETTQMERAIVRLPGVLAKTGLGRSTIYAWVNKGQFPVPVQLGPRAIGWRAADIDQWLEERLSHRRM